MLWGSRACQEDVRWGGVFPAEQQPAEAAAAAGRQSGMLGSQGGGGGGGGGCGWVAARHWRDCHFADALYPSLLKHLPKEEGVHQNDSLADG